MPPRPPNPSPPNSTWKSAASAARATGRWCASSTWWTRCPCRSAAMTTAPRSGRASKSRMPARRRWFGFAAVRPCAGPSTGAALAGLVVAAFFAGRFYPVLQRRDGGAPLPPRTATRRGRERVLLVAVGDYLERSQMVLVELANANAKGPLDISSEQERAGGLVAETRLYRQTAAHTGDTNIDSVLEELERVLVEITHEPSKISPQASGELAPAAGGRRHLVQDPRTGLQRPEPGCTGRTDGRAKTLEGNRTMTNRRMLSSHLFAAWPPAPWHRRRRLRRLPLRLLRLRRRRPLPLPCRPCRPRRPRPCRPLPMPAGAGDGPPAAHTPASSTPDDFNFQFDVDVQEKLEMARAQADDARRADRLSRFQRRCAGTGADGPRAGRRWSARSMPAIARRPWPMARSFASAPLCRLRAAGHQHPTSSCRFSGNEDSNYQRGQGALDAKRWDDAVQYFTEVAAKNGPRADGALYWKAYALKKLGKNSEALAAIAELRKSYAEQPLAG